MAKALNGGPGDGLIDAVKAALGNGHGPKLWWLDLLRREGLFICLILGYGYYFALPDLLAKQKYLDASIEITRKMAENAEESKSLLAEVKANGIKQSGILEGIQKFTGVNTEEHKQVLNDHKTMLEAQKAGFELQKTALSNHEKILTSQTEEMKGQALILTNQSKILGSLDKGGAAKGRE